MPKSRRTSKGTIHAKRLKDLRPFVDFDYDLREPLSAHAKRKIAKYHAALSATLARGEGRVYRPRVKRELDRKQRLKAAQEFGRNKFAGLPGFTVAILDSTPANKVQSIRFDSRGTIRVRHEYFELRFIPFDKPRLATDPTAEITRAVAQAPPTDFYRIAVGEYTIPNPVPARMLAPDIKRLMQKYSVTTLRAEAKRLGRNQASYARAHRWERWLDGLVPLYPENQTELKEFRKRETAYRSQLKKKRLARKRREQRAKQTPNRCPVRGCVLTLGHPRPHRNKRGTEIPT